MLKNKHYLKRQFALAALSVLCACGMGRVAADSSLQTVVQSYKAAASLQKGMIVKLDDKDSSRVEPVTLSTVSKMHGVVVPGSDAPVTLSPVSSTDQQVYVASGGRYEVLVSNQDGAISIGDYITVSSLDGIGMKADSREVQVLGKAAGSFSGQGAESSATIRDQNGATRTVAITRLPIDIAIGPNPNVQSPGHVPGFLQHASTLIAGKSVSPWRIYLGLVVLVGCLLITGSLLYGGVRNGMVAIGRNPLARSSITRNLLQVVITSVIIFIIGLFGVYLLLTLA